MKSSVITVNTTTSTSNMCDQLHLKGLNITISQANGVCSLRKLPDEEEVDNKILHFPGKNLVYRVHQINSNNPPRPPCNTCLTELSQP